MNQLFRYSASGLVQTDRVHSSVYTDPAIFDLEMDRLFGAAWVYIGHHSQLPEPGGFLTNYIGRQPIILVRDAQGEFGAFFNRCTHRGAQLCLEEQGSAPEGFTCPYHGWYFDTGGTLRGVPFRAGYGKNPVQDRSFDLAPVPRVETYRGFIFASLAPEGPSLASYLGPMARAIDELLDRAPEGDIELGAGVHRYAYRGNWKFQMENVVDGYHPPFTHASTIDKSGQQFRRTFAASGYEMDPQGEGLYETGIGKLDQAKTHVFPNGHSYLTNPGGEHRSGEVVDHYWELLARRISSERIAELKEHLILNAAFYPNLVVRVTDNEHIRVARPISVDYTEVFVWPVHLKGAPQEMTAGIVQHSNIHTSATSFIQTDDLVMFERCQQGMQAQRPEWVYFGRGLDMDQPGSAAGERVGGGTWEAPLRTQFAAWRALMDPAGSAE